MGATSVTGVGSGTSRKLTTNELSVLANGPSIIFTGLVEATEGVSSPPTPANFVDFPYPLAGGMDQYVVMLTTINAGSAHVADRDEDDDGNFTGFTFVAESEGTVMYLVAKIGQRPNI